MAQSGLRSSEPSDNGNGLGVPMQIFEGHSIPIASIEDNGGTNSQS